LATKVQHLGGVPIGGHELFHKRFGVIVDDEVGRTDSNGDDLLIEWKELRYAKRGGGRLGQGT
jgi:hypothetical protein